MPKWGKYKKSYRKEWESDQSLKTWITPVVGDDTKAFCKYCQSEIRAQLNDLKVHANTKKHKLHCAPSIKTFTVSAGAAGQCPIKDDQKRREIRIAAYIACHSSINAVDHLSDLLKDEMGTFQMHRTKCTAIIKSVLAPHFREELVEDILFKIKRRKKREFMLIRPVVYKLNNNNNFNNDNIKIIIS